MHLYALIIGGLLGLVIACLISARRRSPGNVHEVLAKLDAAARNRILLKARAGNKIGAIKELRALVETDLLTAKTAVEQLTERGG